MVKLVTYTTRYREGGAEGERAARTLAAELARGGGVECVAVECKRAFVDAVAAIAARGEAIEELHFVGHSGMYGPMFGTRALPEQFSPHEWRQLRIPFAPEARAYFHACRTARWFAPFFARTFGIPSYGYHLYTTYSRRPDRFVRPRPGRDEPLYVVACAGRKSHGLAGSVLKYSGLVPLERMQRCEPAVRDGASYDAVADLYAAAYDDIRVRRDEWRWLDRHLPRDRPRVLDIGCGNGALLHALGDRVREARGVDASPRMLELARARCADQPHLAFDPIDGPRLPYPDDAFDVAISFLSFRYLDWDPIAMEIVRVLRPGGRLLVVDMVEDPLELAHWPRLVASKARVLAGARRNRQFAARLRALVRDPRWAAMLAHNPIRSEHEMKWYLESRFPAGALELLNVGLHSRIVAFDSGPIHADYVLPQSYP